ncbi:hypothetical protein [Mycobacterium sp. EPa45]|uniref:hypothetical protein n=1 Tax=Mycobacterium sp. EPa45 TaxID=1545728 RepID=UPI0006424105|nr:hypothetical protein [Mycobacterium sp. EPa45]AKK26801.1 hypothetical protein AB431_09000 [Mycobacterium sp. EPa45]
MTVTVADSFASAIAGIDDALRCQSRWGCERAAAWRLVLHPGCAAVLVCTGHRDAFIDPVVACVEEYGAVRCPYCRQVFVGSVDAMVTVKPL